MIKFSDKETKFLETLEEARIATSHDEISHVKPVSFIFWKDLILVATDYKTRTFSNIKLNANTSIVIDIYKSGEWKAICMQVKAGIIENGKKFKKFYSIFYKKIERVRKYPWDKNEAPFLKIIQTNKISWGII